MQVRGTAQSKPASQETLRSEHATASASLDQSAPATCIGRRWSTMKKKIPRFKTDKHAENFVATADLTEYDLSGFKPVRFEFERKDARVNMRLPVRFSTP